MHIYRICIHGSYGLHGDPPCTHRNKGYAHGLQSYNSSLKALSRGSILLSKLKAYTGWTNA